MMVSITVKLQIVLAFMTVLLIIVLYKYAQPPTNCPPSAICLLPNTASLAYGIAAINDKTLTVSGMTGCGTFNGSSVLILLSGVPPFTAVLAECAQGTTGTTFSYIPSTPVDLTTFNAYPMMMIML